MKKKLDLELLRLRRDALSYDIKNSPDFQALSSAGESGLFDMNKILRKDRRRASGKKG